MLPIHEVLADLKRALRERTAAVLVAAPGAGKTTVVPLALMDEPWATGGRILVLEPRRLAARAAAEHMARSMGERAGDTVGYRVRMQSKVSARTRVELVTEGVFTRMILDDPGLDGVAGVIFDEFHERSLDGDLGLALARDSQQLLRDDLRLLVMSATLDGARVAAMLDGAAVVESAGRQYPIDTRYLGRDIRAPLPDQVGRAVMKALAEEAGSVLAFLPGQGEIRRTEQWLAERLRDPAVDLAPLFGAMDPAAQDRAISPSPAGRRKIVLATSIAETSLTIEGVRVVVDSGLARVPRFDPSSGLTRLETVRVTQASASQRRGRAGRTGPGVCYRLWDEPETRALIAFGRPEILETDLAGLALDLARWGARDTAGLAFLDQPPAGAMAEARTLLARLQALDADGALTGHGRRMAELPLPPRLAHMVLKGAQASAGELAARIAVLLTERGLGGTDTELTHRLEAFGRDRSPRARDARTLAERWARSAGGGSGEAEPALLLAEAYPERIARRRGKPGEYRLASGRGAYLDATDALARSEWLAVGELGGGEARDRILLAAALDIAEVREAFADRMTVEEVVEANDAGRLEARRRLKLGELVVEERRIERPPGELIAARLLAEAREKGVAALPWGEAARRLRARVAFLRQTLGSDWPDFSDQALASSLEDWLAPLLAGRKSLSQVEPSALHDTLRTLIGWERLRQLDALAPDRFATPAGPSHAIDYAAEGGPRVEARAGEFYGLDRHPTVAGGRVPLTLALLSPAHRPIQVTKDLPGVWRGSWKDVRAEMRGRYPKHLWPEDPASAQPTTRAKPRA
jgi:ATP-dependent RNA helicase HrpB